MTTRSELITSIGTSLHSYSGVHEQMTWLSGAVSSSVLALPVASSEGAKRGIAEIDDELVYVDSVNGTDLVIPPAGRGYKSTTAAAHSSGAMVLFDPTFPRAEIGRAVDQVVASLFPAVYQVKDTTLTAQTIDRSYALPADVESVIRVEAKWTTDPADYWAPINAWELEKTGITPVLNLYNGMLPGWSIRVVYTAKFATLSTDFATAGIPDSLEDAIVYLVSARMLRFLEPARLQLGSVENLSRAQVIDAGAAGKVANQLFGLGQQRIAEERRRLLEAFPIRPNYLAR